MQLQLSLKVADRLHQALLIHGRPMDPAEAVRTLIAAQASSALSNEILTLLVREDRRFCWAAADPGRLSLRGWEIPDPELSTIPFVALDLETTGARPGIGKITEVGAVRIEGFRMIAKFSTLVNPLRPIPPMITRITGITPAMVADAPRIEEVMTSLLEFIEGAVIVAHNAPFDVSFLNYELHRLRSRALGDGAVDTLPLARALAPGLANYRLGTVADAFGAPVTACHRALADAQAVGHVFVELVDRLQRHGVRRLDEMRAYADSSARSCLEKLSLTRDLPPAPGTYRFLDGRGDVLLVGRADSLAEGVRSYFLAVPRRSSKEKAVARLVEQIDWSVAPSPLEAVVQEHSLVREHRPPYNLSGGRPENYVYIRAAGSGPGLSLLASRHAPQWLAETGCASAPARSGLIMGPFRHGTAVNAAVELLRSCHPIKRCPRTRDSRPCSRGKTGLCLSPCTGSDRRTREHDDLVTSIVWWLAGYPRPELPDPARRAEELARQLADQERYDEARALREACGHLQNVRRSYFALAEARALCLACLWPQAGNGAGPSIRFNLVWRGRLVESASVGPESVERQIGRMLDLVRTLAGRSTAGAGSLFVAVPQAELDSLLAVGRWLREDQVAVKVPIPDPGSDPDALAATRARLEAEVRALLSS